MKKVLLLAAAVAILSIRCSSSGSKLTLTITKTGTGTGMVTSDVGGVSCGSTCTASLDSGTAVVLTATADTNSTFTGWTAGGCTGTSTCSVTITADTTVTANFNANASAATAASTSGGVATVTAGGSVVGFIPTTDASGNNIVLAVPLDTGSTSKDASSSLQAEPKQTNVSSGTISFAVNSCAADPTDLKIVCVGYDSTKVAIIDITNYVTKLQSGGTPSASDLSIAEVDLKNTTSGSFSGGSCTNCGVLCDPGDHRFIVSSGDGYRVLKYSDNTATGTATIAKSYLTDTTKTVKQYLGTENFSYDPVNNRIFSPEYDASNGNHLWVVDLTKDKIYRWTTVLADTSVDKTNGITDLNKNVSTVQINEPDASAIDSNTGVLVITDEGQKGVVAVNMNAATFDDTAGTFAAPATAVKLTDIARRIPAVGVESTNHLFFFEEEFSSGMTVVAGPTSSSSSTTLSITDYNSAIVPNASKTCSGVTSWSNAGDPHGLALFTGVVDGKSKGLLIDQAKDCAAVVDLAGLKSAKKSTTAGQTNQVDSSVDLVATGVVKFISLK